MKKVIYSFAILAAVAVSACGGASTEATENVDSTKQIEEVIVDSTVVDSTVADTAAVVDSAAVVK